MASYDLLRKHARSMGISMVSLNCECLNTKKIDALKLFLSSMNSDTSPISCIVLQETWFDSLVDMSLCRYQITTWSQSQLV